MHKYKQVNFIVLAWKSNGSCKFIS